MTPGFRRARPEEAEALTALIYASKQSNGYDDAFMRACAAELRVRPEDIAAGNIWVAKGHDLMGCATLSCSGTVGNISAFFVDPAHKRRGVGRLLWDHLRKEARAQGMIYLRLDADPAAVSFYRAMGWRVTGQSPSGSIPGRTLPLMEYRL